MSDDEARAQQLLTAFQAELNDRVRTLNNLLLRLERDEDDNDARHTMFDGLLREVHSLKGAARAVGSSQVEAAAHGLESVLAAARDAPGTPTQSWYDNAYRLMDQLTPAVTDIEPEPPGPVARESFTAAVPNGPVMAPLQSSAAIADLPDRQRPPAGTRDAAPIDASQTVRVSVSKLDALLAQTGELTVASMRIEQRLGEAANLRQVLDKWRREAGSKRGIWSSLRRRPTTDDGSAHERRAVEAMLDFVDRSEQRIRSLHQQTERLQEQLRADSAELKLVSRAIQEEVYASRLLPATSMFAPFERMVRDLARDQGKTVRLLQSGAEIEIDRRILDQLRDPLMHMLRNAVDHGIESPDERERLGKSPAGTIKLSVTQRSAVVDIELSDDGGGIDRDSLRQAAVRSGRVTADKAASMDDRGILELIYQPGVSTTGEITATSGRGVGMDVVRENIDRLDGSITTSSVPGQGTSFVISVPLSLATTRALLIREGGQLYAVPSRAVERAARVRTEDVRSVEGRLTVADGGRPLVAVNLAAILEQPVVETRPQWHTYLIVRQDDRRVAIITDELAGEVEMVVKRLGWPLTHVQNVTGAAVLSSGEIAVVLNAAELVGNALRLVSGPAQLAQRPAAPTQAPQRSRVLIVDDSLTTRTLERSILESAGYEALTAGDGLEALSVLRGERVDLVLSDVDMPRLDGFALTTEIRRTENLRQIPVILVTSLDADEHRARGMEAGADAYLVKSRFEQTQLLETIGRLL